MEIITHPHPTLKYKSRPVVRINAELKAIVAEMFELMYEAKGVGLAANQVNLPLRLFVANPSGVRGEGEDLVFINPVISKGTGNEVADEGCLSLPGIYGPVNRSKSIHVEAFGIDGSSISMDLDDFLARVVQHETDHLDGVMFTDRMVDHSLQVIQLEIEEFEIEYRSKVADGLVPGEDAVYAELAEWESKFCQ
ncbi:MAG: peptide deformylase [Planctomycetaceae bacterium]|nr:peptide deformylase [Planctomycetaceae bacterium]MBK97037.1 peptide deformylase [Planctomycetaceae bacterium]|tara:strand:- start:10055 stop:10636 length:582 start_codon:yes stop_codon:yes gene_type:complete